MILIAGLLAGACSTRGEYTMSTTEGGELDITRLVEDVGYIPEYCKGRITRLAHPTPPALTPGNKEVLRDALEKYPLARPLSEYVGLSGIPDADRIMYQYTYFVTDSPVHAYTVNLDAEHIIWFRMKGGEILMPLAEESWVVTECDDIDVPTREKQNELGDASFGVFFTRFSKDSLFQKARVRYPLPYYLYPDFPAEKMVNAPVPQGSWRYIDFTRDSLAGTRPTDAYRPVIRITSDTTATYNRQGIENGINVIYKFRKYTPEGWFLVEVEDAST